MVGGWVGGWTVSGVSVRRVGSEWVVVGRVGWGELVVGVWSVGGE